MSTLVTLGCSFSQGDGCYDFKLAKNNIDFTKFRENIIDDVDFQEFRNDNDKNFLHNCIGSNIQERFGFSKFINYAYAGSSNESQMLLFSNNLPTDDDVTVIWQLTFHHREFQLVNQKIMDAGLHYDWVLKSMEEKMVRHSMNDFDIEQDKRFHTALRIEMMYELCKSKGWKLMVWSWMGDDYKHLIELFPKLKEIIIPYENPFHADSVSWEKKYCSKIPKDSHPNEVGYKVISNQICDIIENKMNFNPPLEIPTEKQKIENLFNRGISPILNLI